MKKNLFIQSFQLPVLALALLGICLLAGQSQSRAAIVGPYSVDGSTLHLWHLNESATPAVDAVSPGGTNMTVLGGGATLGNTSYPGFGTALNLMDGGQTGSNIAANIDAYLAPVTLVNGAGDNTPWSFADPTTGAFTFEVVVWVGFNPTVNFGTFANGGTGRNLPFYLFTGEQDGTGGGVRSFQFRLDPIGFAAFTGDPGTNAVRLEIINVNNGASVQNITAPLPTDGPNAIVSNGWYHVAVTYTGDAGTADNLKMYWTAMDPSQEAANEIFSTTMNLDLLGGAIDFTIGNTGRNPPNGNFLGLIDEVRISRVARAANGMMFAPSAVSIVTQPTNVIVGVGQPAELNVVASGATPIAYQWRRNGTPIPGATLSLYSLPSAQLGDAGDYDVVVSNSVNVVTSSIATLTVHAPLDLTWLGIYSGDWDLLTTTNWLDSVNLTNAVFWPGDNVTFDNSASGSTFINLPAPVTPGKVVVNSDYDYTFSSFSGGTITGNAALVKSGPGNLYVDIDTAFTGGTLIDGGTLTLGIADNKGTLGSGPVTNNGAIVIYKGAATTLNGVSGTGSLVNIGTAAVTLSGSSNYFGDITMNANTLTIDGTAQWGNANHITLNATANSAGTTRLTLLNSLTLGSGVTLSLLGNSITPDNRTSLGSTGTNTVNAAIVLGGDGVVNCGSDSGLLAINGPINSPDFYGKFILRGNGNGVFTSSVNIGGHISKTDSGVWTVYTAGGAWTNTDIAGGLLRMAVNDFFPHNITLNFTGAGSLDLNGTHQQVSSLNGPSGTIANSSTNADGTLSLNSVDPSVFGGVIMDSISNGTRRVNFTLLGGSLTLTNTNSYTGDTTISAGTLSLSNNGAISGSANIILAAGATLDASARTDGRLTLNPSQTLKGNGTFNVAGSLTNLGTIQLKLNKSGAVLSNDQLAGVNQLGYGGTLSLLLSGDPLTTSDSFHLFSAAGYAGRFASITPATPGAGLGWDTNTLATDGTLRIVVKTPPTPPTITGYTLSGANLVLSGTGGVPNSTYVVLTSTNAAAPLSAWTPVATASFDGSGHFNVTNAVAPSSPKRFFILQAQ